jgi:hypothetical protein
MGLVQLKSELASKKVALSNTESNIARQEARLKECQTGKDVNGVLLPYGGNTGCAYILQSGARAWQHLIGGLTKLKNEITALELKILAEELREQQFQKEQEILKASFETDKTEQQVAQELAKAKQELARLQVETAKAESASRLASKGDMESARALMGVQEAEGSWKKPVIIGGVVVSAMVVGFIIYKLVK